MRRARPRADRSLVGELIAVELGARSVDHLEATNDEGVRALAGSDVVGVLLPVAALVLGRPMPPARELVDAGAAVALATDFNPGSAFCESLPLVTLARLHAARPLAGRGARRRSRSTPLTCSAARTASAARARLRRGLVLLGAPDWRHLAYHVGGEVVAAWSGRAAWSGGARLGLVPTRKQRRRREKERRHEYEYVYVDEEGREVEVDEPAQRPPKSRNGNAR